MGVLLMLCSFASFGQLQHIGSYVIDGMSCAHTEGTIIDINPIIIYTETDSTVTITNPASGVSQVGSILSIVEASVNAYGYELEILDKEGKPVVARFIRFGDIAIATMLDGEVRYFYFQGKWPEAPSKVKKQQS